MPQKIIRGLDGFRTFPITAINCILPVVGLPGEASGRGSTLTTKCPPVYDQGESRKLYRQRVGCSSVRSHEATPSRYPPSRLFIYYNERVMEGRWTRIPAPRSRDGIKSVGARAIALKSPGPYNIAKFRDKPARLLRSRREAQGDSVPPAQPFTEFDEGLSRGVGIRSSSRVRVQQLRQRRAFQTGDFPLPAPGEDGPGEGGRPEGHAMLASARRSIPAVHPTKLLGKPDSGRRVTGRSVAPISPTRAWRTTSGPSHARGPAAIPIVVMLRRPDPRRCCGPHG